MNFDGLKNAIVKLIAGERIAINPNKFQNDMISMNSRDDVLALLVHLGYLGYLETKSEVFIPNEEVAIEFSNAVEDTGWNDVISAIENSHKLLESTWAGDEKTVR